MHLSHAEADTSLKLHVHAKITYLKWTESLRVELIGKFYSIDTTPLSIFPSYTEGELLLS